MVSWYLNGDILHACLKFQSQVRVEFIKNVVPVTGCSSKEVISVHADVKVGRTAGAGNNRARRYGMHVDG